VPSRRNRSERVPGCGGVGTFQQQQQGSGGCGGTGTFPLPVVTSTRPSRTASLAREPNLIIRACCMHLLL
jgi:hypothetical protein